MLHRLLPALCLCILAIPAWSQEAAGGLAESVPEKILVVGQRPGPGLWKISKDGHVLWVFGTYNPLPKKMEWRSHEVETILSQSQEYLPLPAWSASVGFFRGITLLPHVIGMKKNPDGAKLKDLMPADVYARWLVLKTKYIGENEELERERPFFAADALYRNALMHAGLSNGHEVVNAIDALVKQKKIKTTHSAIKLSMDDPAKLLKDFKKSPLEDVECFSKTLERLETDIDAMRIRANAWAKGDLGTIEKLSYADRDAACGNAMLNSAAFKAQPGFDGVQERVLALWLAAAEKALATNASTFAVLHMRDILDPRGYVAALQAKGYLVEKPD